MPTVELGYGGEVTPKGRIAPESLPQTGGLPFPVEVLLGFGVLATAAGVHLHRRNT